MKRALGQARQDSFGIPADESGRAGICAEQVLDPFLFFAMDAMDLAVTCEKIRDGGPLLPFVEAL